MDCTLTYIEHNSFVLKGPDRTFLFDLPNPPHLSDAGLAAARRAVAGTDLAVFISHGHEDHLHRDLASVTGAAASVCYVLSDDIEELVPEGVPDNGEVLVVEPDEGYAFRGMAIATLMSNDLGVAFLIEDGPLRLYYGGDLAEWIWPGASESEAGFTARYFRQCLERVHDFRPHVAFSNLDRRLPNLAGGGEACRVIDAPVFVPMHGFGDRGWLGEMGRAIGPCPAQLFTYTAPGDSRTFAL